MSARTIVGTGTRVIAASLWLAGPAAAVDVLTQHNDLQRTGGNPNETQLTTANVNQTQFGRLWSYPVDGHVFAQPLVAQGVVVGGSTRNVVYLTTMHNSVYAFDADSGSQTPLWSVNLGPSVPLPDATIGANCGSYRDTFYEIGIQSTPVIDRASNTLYLVSMTSGYVHRIHALDLGSGANKLGGPATISASLNSRTLQGRYANQRASLVLANGRVYVGFSGYCDTGTYYGWLLGYSASNLATAPVVFNAAEDGSSNGIWMGGGAPAVDALGNVYLTTGNGTANAQSGGRSYAHSFLKLSPALTVIDWFTPYNWSSLNGSDLDLGSAGVLLVPNTSTVLSAGKEGKVYLVNTSNMGHHNTSSDAQILQSFKPFPAHLHGGPAYWASPEGPLVYMMAEHDYLKAFRLENGVLNTTPFSQSALRAPLNSMPGGMISVSSNGSLAGSGIVWVNVPIVGDANNGLVMGVLRAFNASNLTQEIWHSQMNAGRDAFGLFAKFVPPTVANGRVYMSSFSKRVHVYGLLGSVPVPSPSPTPAIPPSGNVALGKYAGGSVPCIQQEAAEKALNGSWTGGTSDKWCSSQSSRFFIVDLGGSYTITSFTLRHSGAGGESATWNTRDFDIQLSPDALTWTTVVTVTGNTADVTNHPIAARAARYARLNVTAPTSTDDARARVYEFEVYAGTGGTPTPTASPTPTPTATPTTQPTPNGSNVALGKAASGSAACAATEGPEKAVNGSVSGGNADKFCSAAAPLFLQVDLGSSFNVNGFVVKHAGAGGESATLNTRDFTLQLSPDNVTWTAVATVAGNTVNVSTHVIASRAARYARLDITTATQTGEATARIYELEVYGTGGATPTATSRPRATPTFTSTPTPTTRPRATATPTATLGTACAIGSTCEAESALMAGGVAASAVHAGYTGSGFADYPGNGGGSVEWTVNVPTAGTYTLAFRYANGGTADRPMSVSVNGTVVSASLSFPVTAWTTWTARTLSAALPAGSVKIRALELPNGPNVDNLVVTAAATPTPTATATPRATPTATATPTTGGTPAWAPNTAYTVGQLVTYGGLTYRCIQAHTSLVGWEPPNAASLWTPQ